MSSFDADFRPEVRRYSVLRGLAWSVKAALSKDGIPVDLTGAAIVGTFAADEAETPLAISSTPEGLAAGEFWYGQNDPQANGSWIVVITESGGLPRAYYRGIVVVSERPGDGV